MERQLVDAGFVVYDKAQTSSTRVQHGVRCRLALVGTCPVRLVPRHRQLTFRHVSTGRRLGGLLRTRSSGVRSGHGSGDVALRLSHAGHKDLRIARATILAPECQTSACGIPDDDGRTLKDAARLVVPI